MTHYPTLSHYQTMNPTLRMSGFNANKNQTTAQHVNRWAFLLTTLASMLELHEARTTRDLISQSASAAHGIWHGVFVFAITLAVGVLIASIAQAAMKATQALTSPSPGRAKLAA